MRDVHGRRITLTNERKEHMRSEHPEMSGQVRRISEALRDPDLIVRSTVDPEVELFYRHYDTTPVTEKHLCIVLKTSGADAFIITAYFTDTIKKGDVLWRTR
jgi:hypothetical protein